MNLPSAVSIDFGQSRPSENRHRDDIPLTPGFTRTTLDDARSFQVRADVGRADVAHTWPLQNRKTGLVECVIGPCTFDEMIETWTKLEGHAPVAEYRHWQRGRQ